MASNATDSIIFLLFSPRNSASSFSETDATHTSNYLLTGASNHNYSNTTYNWFFFPLPYFWILSFMMAISSSRACLWKQTDILKPHGGTVTTFSKNFSILKGCTLTCLHRRVACVDVWILPSPDYPDTSIAAPQYGQSRKNLIFNIEMCAMTYFLGICTPL